MENIYFLSFFHKRVAKRRFATFVVRQRLVSLWEFLKVKKKDINESD